MLVNARTCCRSPWALAWYLVHDVLLVDGLQDLGLDDGVEVGVHELEGQVDVLVVAGTHHVQQLDDVLVRGEELCACVREHVCVRECACERVCVCVCV